MVPLYYAGLKDAKTINVTWEPWEDMIMTSDSLIVNVDWRGRVIVNVTVDARSMTWATFVSAT